LPVKDMNLSLPPGGIHIIHTIRKPGKYRPYLLLPLKVKIFNDMQSFHQYILIIAALCATALPLSAQRTGAAPEVKSPASENYAFPFAGGMNACQFGEIDLNMDGIKDLVAFDRQGNRLMPFINNGIPGEISYTFAPEYISSFPGLSHWMILTDYNMDGREDLFTYNPQSPGIVVYKNTSQAELRFERVAYPYLTSWYGSGYVNILVTYADYPGIYDIDGDGDLDILTFWALGSFVEMHKNLSMETYGIPDSLIFERTAYCWGYFAENEESNELYLDTCFGARGETLREFTPRDRHTGSTLLLTDMNNDQLADLILGDVDYPTLFLLMNGGTQEEAYMTSYNKDFPNEDDPAWLFSMPVAAMADVNNNGLRDLIISPFDPNPFVNQNFNSVWLYINEGSNEYPDFRLSTKSFLQENMIDCGSGAYPVFADINLNGLPDLVIGNYGYYQSSWYDNNMILHSEYASRIALFMNTGEAGAPVFEFVTDDLGLIGEMGIRGAYPAFGDIDGDGDPDMIVGRDDGTLMFFRNCACLGNPLDFQLEAVNYQDIDVGEYSTPFIFDLDEDGLPDLIIGEKAGNLNYYRNTGDAYTPVFTLLTDSLGKVNVTDYNLSYNGYSTPFIFRAGDGKLRLVSGSEQGSIFFFTDIEDNLEGSFTPSDDLWMEIDSLEFTIRNAYRSAACLADLNDDGYFELLTGNFSGGLELYSNMQPPPVTMDIPDNGREAAGGSLHIYPNPAGEELNILFDAGSGDEKERYRLRLTTLYGNTVYEGFVKENLKYTIQLGNLPNGVYLCIISSDTDYKPKAYSKVVIQR
jgi:hypothetical protein